MRTGKILGLVVGGLVAMVVIALLLVKLFVNPNDYKPRIEGAVKKATGRELTLSGDIKLSVFPWIALELGPASLGNPAGFPEQPFVSFTHASVRVKVLPLLSKRLEIGRVELDGLDVKLLKNAAGKGNWEGFGSSAQSTTPAEPTKGAGEELSAIEGIKITNAQASYEKLVVSKISLETGSFSGRGVVPVTLHVEAERGVANEHATLDARFDLSLDPAAKRYGIAALNLNSTVARAPDGKPQTFTFTAPAIDVDLGAQTLHAAAFAANLADAEIRGSLQGTSIVDAPEIQGTVSLAPLVVREYLPKFGVTLPPTRDPKALASVAVEGNFSYGKGMAKIEGLKATLDDTHLTGEAGLTLESEAVTFALAVDRIDVDRYLPPAEQGSVKPSAAAAANGGAGGAGEAKGGAAAKPLEAHGTLTVGALHFAPLDLEHVLVTVAAHDQVMHIYPLKAGVDGGQYSGDVTLDSRTAVPAVSMDEHLTGVDVGKLMAAESKKLKVSGRGNVNLKATAHGVGADALMKTVDGHFDLAVADGAVEGVDLGFELARAEALLSRKELPNAQSAGRTKFDAFKMSAAIASGVATTKDLVISSPVLKVTGQGSANLPAQSLDFALLADTGRSAGGTALQVPIKVTGNISSPTILPDVQALAKGQLKQKLQNVVQDKLKGLFSK